MRAFATTLILSQALALAPAAAGGEPAQSLGVTDPAVTAFTPPSSQPSLAPQAFPLSAYSAFGSSMAKTGRFAELGWSDAQFNALLAGMRATFQGKGYPFDAPSQQLAAETARRIAGMTASTPTLSLPSSASEAFPLSAYSAFGSSLARTGHFAELGWADAQFDALLDGMLAAFHDKVVPMDASSQQLAAQTSRRIKEIMARARQEADGTLDQKGRLARYFKVMRKRLELQISDSGLGYNVEPADRNGVRPRPGDTIILTCHAAAADGVTKLPQLSAERIRVKMEGMLPGLMEGLQMMTVDSSAVFVLPPSLSFGAGAWPDGVERGSPLVYTITLNDVISAGAQP